MKEIDLTYNDFDSVVMESDKPVLVDFWATWCGPCRMLGPVIAQIAEERDDIKVCKVNVDDEPELAQRLHLLLFGAIKDASLLDQIALPYTHLGVVHDVARVYSHGDIVLSTSLYETLPGTLIEGQASGCLPVTFGMGGQSDIVDHLKTGYIAEYKDAASIAEGIDWAIGANVSRQFLHDEVERKFAASKIAQQYIELFENIIT